MSKKKYIVKFDDKGYYAKKQPNYEYSYTNNREEANEYSTFRGVLDRVLDGFCIVVTAYQKHEVAIVETFEVETVINGDVITITKTFLESEEWTRERFQEIEDKLNEKKAEIERERLKAPEYQTNVKIEEDKEFWDKEEEFDFIIKDNE